MSAAAGDAAPADRLRGKGTAKVWTARQTNGKIPALVAAPDTLPLEELLRPLPHSGSEIFLTFDDGKVIERGVWPVRSQEWDISIR